MPECFIDEENTMRIPMQSCRKMGTCESCYNKFSCGGPTAPPQKKISASVFISLHISKQSRTQETLNISMCADISNYTKMVKKKLSYITFTCHLSHVTHANSHSRGRSPCPGNGTLHLNPLLDEQRIAYNPPLPKVKFTRVSQ